MRDGTQKTIRAMPVLDCTDVERSVAFYRDRLGFAASTFGAPPTFAILQRGTVTLGLAKVDGAPAVSRNWAAYVYVADADALYGEFNAHGAGLTEPPIDKPYNCRDFTVDDPDGHLIAFGHTLDIDPLGPGLSDRLGRDGERS
jgi:predicted enzyme related to lactoylglutathione lyase